MGLACGAQGGRRSGYKVFIRNPEGDRPLGKSTHVCADNIKTKFSDIRWNGVNSSDLA
jgi:hypothetical protein